MYLETNLVVNESSVCSGNVYISSICTCLEQERSCLQCHLLILDNTDDILRLTDSPEKNVLLRVQSDAPRDQFVVNKEYK